MTMTAGQPRHSPRVSVVLPIHNGAAFLVEAVESLLNQTFPDLEILALDDGSDDDSLALLEPIAHRDPRLRILPRPWRGLVPTLNEGLELARGEFIARMDADDICYPHRLERQVDLMDRAPFIGLCGTATRTFGGPDGSQRRHLVNHEDLDAWLPMGVPLAHPTVMFRRELVEDSLRYRSSFTYAEDMDLWERMLRRTRAVNIPEPLLHYRHHDNNISDRKATQVLLNHLRITHRRLGELGLDPSPEELRAFIGRGEHPGGITGLREFYDRTFEANRQAGRYRPRSLAHALSSIYQRSLTRYYGIPAWVQLHRHPPQWYRQRALPLQTPSPGQAIGRSLRNLLGRPKPFAEVITPSAEQIRAGTGLE
jgi:glycosyltransferase involved in cell wall biosynthesis